MAIFRYFALVAAVAAELTSVMAEEPVAVVVLSVFTAVLLVSILVPMLSLLSAV